MKYHCIVIYELQKLETDATNMLLPAKLISFLSYQKELYVECGGIRIT